MTGYAIQIKGKNSYWNDEFKMWDGLAYLYDSVTSAEAVKEVRGNVTLCMKDAVIVEVTCDIKPVKEWVKIPLCTVMNLFPLTSIELIHSRLSDGTLRVCGDGWEVYE